MIDIIISVLTGLSIGQVKEVLSSPMCKKEMRESGGIWGRFSYSIRITNNYELFFWSASLRSAALQGPFLAVST